MFAYVHAHIQRTTINRGFFCNKLCFKKLVDPTRIYCIAQGTLFSTLQQPKWEKF